MVYLLCFSEPVGTERHSVRHYAGFAESDVDARLAQHRSGRGARLTQVAVERGVKLTLVRVWPEGDRKFERSLKDGSLTELCPNCRAASMARRTALQKARRAARRLKGFAPCDIPF
jgi:hypothetical protein